MTRMDALVQFLRDRYDEDERVAQECDGADWWLHPASWVSCPPLRRVALVVHDGNRAHIARHDPVRVLREINAKRALLDRFLPDAASADEQINEEWHAGSTLADDLLALLALPYADHPEYRDDWRP